MHKKSDECEVSVLDLFTTPATQTSVEDASIVEHNPIHSLTHGGLIEVLSLGNLHIRDQWYAFSTQVSSKNKLNRGFRR